MNKKKYSIYLLLLPGLILSMSACKGLGAKALKANRGAYIEALSRTDKEEMLANIVRAKYNDPPVFLKINAITAAPSIDLGVGGEGKFGSENYALASPSFHYHESPTILYTPMMGSEYSTQLLMPMSLTNVFLMLNNGFNMEIVSDLVIKSINEKTNSRTASDSARKDFKKVIQAMDRLIEQKLIILGTQKDPKQISDFTILADVREEALQTEDYKYLVKELGLEQKSGPIEMKLGFAKNAHTLAITTRSFLATINYLSNFVDIPKRDASSVWKSNLSSQSGPLHIYTSSKMPNDANTAVFLYGNWFYIKSEDIESQNILYLLQILFDIQAHIGKNEGKFQFSLPVR